MSRIRRKPIVIPAGVTVTVDEAAHTVAVKGPKGSLNSNYHPLMTVKVEGNEVLVTRPNDESKARSLHGLTRTNIANMVNGVVNGCEKKLEIVGVGLRCQKQGSRPGHEPGLLPPGEYPRYRGLHHRVAGSQPLLCYRY